jgi:hypothetical protein
MILCEEVNVAFFKDEIELEYFSVLKRKYDPGLLRAFSYLVAKKLQITSWKDYLLTIDFISQRDELKIRTLLKGPC